MGWDAGWGHRSEVLDPHLDRPTFRGFEEWRNERGCPAEGYPRQDRIPGRLEVDVELRVRPRLV
jgi:hypothetical protein